MKFCPTFWVENVTVAERAINTWFSVLKGVNPLRFYTVNQLTGFHIRATPALNGLNTMKDLLQVKVLRASLLRL